MTQQMFGKDIPRAFYPEFDKKPVSLPTQNPAIYVFDSKPTREDAAAGTGAIATLTIWTAQDVPPYGRSWTIPAIDDPDPTSSTRCATYWEAINYVYATGEQSQLILRAFELERGFGPDSWPDISIQDLKNMYPAISKYADTAELEEFITLATQLLRIDIEAKNFNWRKLSGIDVLKLPLAFKTIAMVAASQIRAPDDRFVYRYDMFSKLYGDALNSITVPYDADEDGEAETEVQTNSGVWLVDR